MADVCGWVSALAHDPLTSILLFSSWQAFPTLMWCLMIKVSGLFFLKIYYLFKNTRDCMIASVKVLLN